MRAKRSKKYRKIIQQYSLNFGFREPYQVLVDSLHLRALHSFSIPLQQYLRNTLHGAVKPFVTRCTLASILQTTNLQTSQRPAFLPPPADLPLRHCRHTDIAQDDVLPESECLLDLLSGGARGKDGQERRNKQHFVLATADVVDKDSTKRKGKSSESRTDDIRARAREIPGVPIIYVKRSVMTLEELSSASLGVRRRVERDKFKEGLLGMGDRKRKRAADDERDAEAAAKGTGTESAPAAPKTKKARGPKQPNPLSVKKKKKKPVLQPAAREKADEASTPSLETVTAPPRDPSQPKAKRKRRHSKRETEDRNGILGDRIQTAPEPSIPAAVVAAAA